MRTSIFIFINLLFLHVSVFSQVDFQYVKVVASDTFQLKLTDQEVSDSEIKKIIKLNSASTTKRKKARIHENILSEIQLKGSDSIFHVHIHDYYDKGYLIGFVTYLEKGAKKKDTRKSPLGYRRISFDQIDLIATKGRVKEMPILITGYLLWTGGIGMALLPAAGLVGLTGSFPLWLTPIGLSLFYLSTKIVEPILRRTYFMDLWQMEVVSKRRK